MGKHRIYKVVCHSDIKEGSVREHTDAESPVGFGGYSTVKLTVFTLEYAYNLLQSRLIFEGMVERC